MKGHRSNQYRDSPVSLLALSELRRLGAIGYGSNLPRFGDGEAIAPRNSLTFAYGSYAKLNEFHAQRMIVAAFARPQPVRYMLPRARTRRAQGMLKDMEKLSGSCRISFYINDGDHLSRNEPDLPSES